MIVAIDIGNTTVTLGAFDKGGLRARAALRTDDLRVPAQLLRTLKGTFRKKRVNLKKADQIVLCSVVPQISRALMKALGKITQAPIAQVGSDLKVPIKNRYRYPEQVGQDRLVGSYEAYSSYRRDCIVADFGTALTMDIVTKRGEYLGGVIVPGIEISLDALASKTALLPKVLLRKPRELLGRDTANSIRSGLIYGYAALCDGLVARFRKHYVAGATVVATGGYSSLVADCAQTIHNLRPNLVLEGLNRLGATRAQAQK